MVRSSFVVVSDDQLLIQKANQFCMANGMTVKVMSPAEWDTLNSHGGEVPSLVSGAGQAEGSGSGYTAKVLPFPLLVTRVLKLVVRSRLSINSRALPLKMQLLHSKGISLKLRKRLVSVAQLCIAK